MRNNTEPCRVCGKPFVPCGKSSAEIGAFNYREVSCSSECGQIYLQRVIKARQPKTVENIASEVTKNSKKVVKKQTK